ncbi:MAG TPA: rhomboid family intramembrane serine protease, partial [Egibacteraceae bacterium]|nr:rhomboid family intramembrane serine protease [Egibacteraceae bacterium]
HGILAVCVGLFAAGLLLPGLGQELFAWGSQRNPLVTAGQWYRLFTSAFLHAGLAHVLFNMWALYLFGPGLERDVGSAPFAALYLSSALAGGAAFYLWGAPVPAVGASGAIFGLFGAWLAAAFRARHTVAGRAGFQQLLMLLGINLALPLVVPGIAWQAHLGGLVAGAAIALAWALPGLRRPGGRSAVAAAVGIVALAVVV